MNHCENCGTEFEGELCPRCGDVPQIKLQGGQAVREPVRLREWQVALIAVSGAVLGILLLTGALFAKDRVDQHAFDLKLARMEEELLFPEPGAGPEMPAGSSDFAPVTESGPAQSDYGTVNPLRQPDRPMSSDIRSSSQAAVDSSAERKFNTSSANRDMFSESDPDSPFKTTEEELREPDDLLRVFDDPIPYLRQKVTFRGVIVEYEKQLEYVVVSVALNDQTRQVAVGLCKFGTDFPIGSVVEVGDYLSGWMFDGSDGIHEPMSLVLEYSFAMLEE